MIINNGVPGSSAIAQSSVKAPAVELTPAVANQQKSAQVDPSKKTDAETRVAAISSLAEKATVKDALADEANEKTELEGAVKQLNDYVQNIKRTLSFEIEESTGNTVISVYDAETAELIRQIPPEETLNLARMLEGQPMSLFIKSQV